LFRRFWEKLKTLWRLALSERATPPEIGWAVALGAFVGCTPLIGIRPWLALGLATLLKKNRLFAYLASHTSFWLFVPFITIAEVQVSHRLRTGSWVIIDREHILSQAGTLLLDWWLGTIPVGGGIALVMGFAAYAWALKRKPTESPRPSSGSPS
jgi:uncharacterized protein (DUF2062 family)